MALSRVKSDLIVKLDASKVEGALPALVGSNLLGVSSGGADQASRNNLALNFFEDSVRDNMDRLSLSQGWVDTFEDASDVVGEGFKVATTYTAQFVDDIYRKTGNLDGLTDGTNGIFFCRINFNGNDGVESLIVRNGSSRFKIFRNTSNQIAASMTGTSSVNILETASSTSYTSSSETITILMSWNSSNFTMYIDDVEAVNTSMSGANIDYTGGDWGIMGHPVNDTEHLHADISQLYLDTTNTLDLSVAANRRLFTESADDNFPLDLSGVKSPILYFNSAHPNWGITNLGTGGNFFLAAGGGAGDGGSTPLPNTISDALYSSESFTNSYELIDSYGKENQVNTYSLDSSTDSAVGQCVNIAADIMVTKVSFLLLKFGAPTGTCHCEIMGVTGAIGSSAVGDSNTIAISAGIDVSTINTTPVAVHTFTFPEPVLLSGSTDYCFAVTYYGGNSSNKIQAGGLTTSGTSHATGNMADRTNAGTWAFLNNDLCFYVYGTKNLDLITKGSDDIGNSPATAPATGHMEVLMTERPASGTSVWSDVLDTDTAGFRNYSLRQRVTLSASGSMARVTFVGAAAGGGLHIDNASFMKQSGLTFNGTGSITNILFGGNASAIVPVGGTLVSDWFDHSVTADAYIIVIDIADDSNNDDMRYISTGGEGTVYTPSHNSYNILNWVGTQDRPGMTHCISKIETAVDQVVNTDIIAEMSRDGGTTYSPATLNRLKTRVGATNKNILGGAVDFAGDPSGTDIVGRVRSVNKDKITVHGVSVNWS